MTISFQTLQKSLFIRLFEYSVVFAAEAGYIKIPYYLCIGQELVPAICSDILQGYAIFAQHRAHGYYLAFGGDPQMLVDELLSLPTGCCGGRGGSASIQSKTIPMFGHSGFMGDNIPIGIGYSLATDKPVLLVAGDAAAEEDYSLTAAGYAATKKANLIFLCEDNNLSILTPKSDRRSWELDNVMTSFGLNSFDVPTNKLPDLESILRICIQSSRPCFLNVHVQRAIWHAGSGFDGISNTDQLFKAVSELDCSSKDSLLSFDVDLITKYWKPHLKADDFTELQNFLRSILSSSQLLRP